MKTNKKENANHGAFNSMAYSITEQKLKANFHLEQAQMMSCCFILLGPCHLKKKNHKTKDNI